MQRACVLLAALLLAGCLQPPEAPEPASTRTDAAAETEDAAGAPEMVLLASPCGFQLRYPAGWTFFGAAEDGFVRLGSPDGTEAFLLMEGPAGAMESIRGTWADAAAMRGHVERERGPVVAFGGPAEQVVTEDDATRLIAVTAVSGDRGLFALRSFPLGAEPSLALAEIFLSVERTPPREGCRDEPPATTGDGWVDFRSPDGWSVSHPASWEANSYASSMLSLTTPRNGTDDAFREALTVVVVPNAENLTLDETVVAYLAALEQRKIDFEVQASGYGEIDGRQTAVIYSWERGVQGPEWDARVVDLREGHIVLFEMELADELGPFTEEMGRVIASFTFAPGAP